MTKINNTKKMIRKIVSNARPFIKKHAVMLGLYLLIFLFFINAMIMSLFYINRSYDYKIVNHLYISAVTPNQDVTGTMRTKIVKIKELEIDSLTPDDQVVFCCDFGTEEYWVEDVVAVNQNNNTIVGTYDDVTTTQVTDEEVFGVYVKEANFFGTIYYTSMYLEGYLFLMASQIFIIGLYYFVVVKKTLKSLWEEKHDLSEVDDESIKKTN